MATWDKRTLEIPQAHGRHARPGCRILVADRGAVRFDFPDDWLVVPADDCTLTPTVMSLPPGDRSGVALPGLLGRAAGGDGRPPAARGPIRRGDGADLDLAWAEVRFAGPTRGGRAARSRICLARAGNVQPLITFDSWDADADRSGPAWDEILRSLRVAEPVLDPTLGQPNRG